MPTDSVLQISWTTVHVVFRLLFVVVVVICVEDAPHDYEKAKSASWDVRRKQKLR